MWSQTVPLTAAACSESVGRSDWFQTAAVYDVVWHSFAGDRDKLFCVVCTVSQWMPVSREISRFNRCVLGLFSWLNTRSSSSTFSVFSLTHTQNAVCHCPVADQSYPLFGLSLTEWRYFHILSTCYEPVWQILGLKKLMCKWNIV